MSFKVLDSFGILNIFDGWLSVDDFIDIFGCFHSLSYFPDAW